MKMSKRLILSLSLLLLPLAASANYQSEIDRFFELFEKGMKVEAVDSIYSTNPWMNSAADAIQNIKSQFGDIEKLVGSYNGKEKIGELNIKDRFIHVTYLALYDRQPVRMEFQFYRPQEEWVIYSFSFDISIDDEIEASARTLISEGR